MTSSKVWTVVLLLASLPVGFIIGGWVGAQWLIPDHAGLAAGAMVFWYALLGAVSSLVVAIVMVSRCSPKQIKPTALVVLALALVGLSGLGLMIQQQRYEQEQQYQSTLATLPELLVSLARRSDNEITRLSYQSESGLLELDSSDGRRCSVQLAGAPAADVHLDLLKALRALDVAGLPIKPAACQRQGDEVAALEFTIVESRPPVTRGRLRITQACIAEYAALDDLMRVTEQLYARQADNMHCSDVSRSSRTQ